MPTQQEVGDNVERKLREATDDYVSAAAAFTLAQIRTGPQIKDYWDPNGHTWAYMGFLRRELHTQDLPNQAGTRLVRMITVIRMGCYRHGRSLDINPVTRVTALYSLCWMALKLENYIRFEVGSDQALQGLPLAIWDVPSGPMFCLELAVEGIMEILSHAPWGEMELIGRETHHLPVMRMLEIVCEVLTEPESVLPNTSQFLGVESLIDSMLRSFGPPRENGIG